MVVARAVGLDVPALDAAGKGGRKADVPVLRGRSNSRRDCGSEGDEYDGGKRRLACLGASDVSGSESAAFRNGV
jgi:hypothetical protein